MRSVCNAAATLTMPAIFEPIDRWTVKYGSVSIQWRARPETSRTRLLQLIGRGESRLLADALGRYAPTGVRAVENDLVKILKTSPDPLTRYATARVLRYGVTTASRRALEVALQKAAAANDDAAVVECVAALYHRRNRDSVHRLVQYAGTLDPERLAWFAGFALARQLPARIWPSKLVRAMRQSDSGRFVAAGILLAQGDRDGEDILLQALAGADRERLFAVNAASRVANAKAYRVLKAAWESETDLALRVAICAQLGRRCSAVERVELLTRAFQDESPVVRFQAAQQVCFLPAKMRRSVIREWLRNEPDRFVRRTLRSSASLRAPSSSGS